MRRATLIIIAVLCCPFGPGANLLQAEVEFKLSYEYFPVQYIPGMPIEEMIARSSPLRLENGVHVSVGRASWNFGSPKVTFTNPLVGVCLIDRPDIVCNCEITLPQLAEGNAETRAGFEVELAKISKHETEHCNIALAHARILEKRLLKIGQRPCDKIGDDMRREYRVVYDDCKREQQQFDINEYAYSHYLRLESMRSMIDSGARYLPPASGYGAPALDTKKRNFEVLESNPEQLSKDGFYKDKNGVWRNY